MSYNPNIKTLLQLGKPWWKPTQPQFLVPRHMLSGTARSEGVAKLRAKNGALFQASGSEQVEGMIRVCQNTKAWGLHVIFKTIIFNSRATSREAHGWGRNEWKSLFQFLFSGSILVFGCAIIQSMVEFTFGLLKNYVLLCPPKEYWGTVLPVIAWKDSAWRSARWRYGLVGSKVYDNSADYPPEV